MPLPVPLPARYKHTTHPHTHKNAAVPPKWTNPAVNENSIAIKYKVFDYEFLSFLLDFIRKVYDFEFINSK